MSPLIGSKLSVAVEPSEEKEFGPLASSSDSKNDKTDNGDGARSETSNHASSSSSSLPDSPTLPKESRKKKIGDKAPSDGTLDERLHSRRKLRSASAIPLDPDQR